MSVKKLTKKVLEGWVQGLMGTDKVVGVQARGDSSSSLR